MEDIQHPPSARTSRKKAPEGFYTARQAAGVLGIPPSTFRNYVKLGLIPREVPEERSEGFYSAALIAALVPLFATRETLTPTVLRREMAHIRDRIIPKKPWLGVTDWITFDDLAYVQHLDLQMYGVENTVDMSITWPWWQANPYMCRVLFDVADRKVIWGALTVMPMREETIFRLLRHEMAEREITPQDILPYEVGHSYSCYVPSLVIRPERRTHMRILIKSVLDFWCASYPQIKIDRLYAYDASLEGARMIHHLFFSPRYDIGENAYELRPLRPGNPSPLIQEYQSCIQQREEAESGL
jgi:hypothetical protein